MARPRATPEVLVDDDDVRVTRWDFAPGAETGWHRHGLNYVITTITHCRMLVEEPGGTSRIAEMAAGFAYRRQAGVEHNVVNSADVGMSFVELELKG